MTMRKANSRRLHDVLRLVAFAAVLAAIPAHAGLPACGDIDGERGINATDAYHALRSAVGLALVDIALGDVDADGSVGLRDALILLRHAITGAPALACPVPVMFYVENNARISGLVLRVSDIGVIFYDAGDGEYVLQCYDVFAGSVGVGFAEYDYDARKLVFGGIRNQPVTGPVNVMRCWVRPDWSFNEDHVLFLDALVYRLGAEAPEPPDIWPEIAVRPD